MLLDESAKPILERYWVASELEGAAIKRLHDAMAAGERNQRTLMRLAQEMGDATDEKMRIPQELEAVRLDKPKR